MKLLSKLAMVLGVVSLMSVAAFAVETGDTKTGPTSSDEDFCKIEKVAESNDKSLTDKSKTGEKKMESQSKSAD